MRKIVLIAIGGVVAAVCSIADNRGWLSQWNAAGHEARLHSLAMARNTIALRDESIHSETDTLREEAAFEGLAEAVDPESGAHSRTAERQSEEKNASPEMSSQLSGNVALAAKTALAADALQQAVAELLPTSGSEPAYEPWAWNHWDLLAGNNCYAYACDDLDPHRRDVDDFPQPGNTAGLESADRADYSAPLLRRRAIEDGLIPAPPGREDAPPAGFYCVALFVAPGEDYHWYRQDADGYWSHKLADGPVQNVDADGRPIADPRAAGQNYENRIRQSNGEMGGYNYSQFGGFFYVPQGGIRLHTIRR